VQRLTLDKGAESDNKPLNAEAIKREKIVRRAALEFRVTVNINPF
jgi:hypothetical protein